jgi:hypothetical protein
MQKDCLFQWAQQHDAVNLTRVIFLKVKDLALQIRKSWLALHMLFILSFYAFLNTVGTLVSLHPCKQFMTSPFILRFFHDEIELWCSVIQMAF